MKHFLFIIILVLVCCSCSHAQFIRGYGIKGGVVLANQDPSPGTYAFKDRIGMDVGAYVELVDVPVFSALLELHYIQKGMEGTTVYDNISINYLSFPILAKLSIKQFAVTPYLLVGPRIDVMVSNDQYISNIIVGGETIREFEDVVFGIDIGLGLETSIVKPLRFLFEFRYSPDITYAIKKPYERKNRSFEFLIGVGL